MSAIVPIPRTPIDIRVATLADLPFIDALQKRHTRMVGWMPLQQIEGKIAAGQVLVAWAAGPCSSEEEENTGWQPVPRGYIIAQDRYFKRDDCGIIYQLNVEPTRRRKLIGAALVKAAFERAAWGCRLFCLWCAQDIEANRFWESIGFIPLAFRTGSAQKGRVHIFWQRRIREGDAATPYWFPAQTTGGSIREDRIVLPIPPGVRWWDEMPIVLPAEGNPKLEIRNSKQIQSAKAPNCKVIAKRKSAKANPPRRAVISMGGLWMAAPAEQETPAAGAAAREKPKRAAREKRLDEAHRGARACPERSRRNDPKLVSAARELRDRWLERVNAGGEAAQLAGAGKYDVSRTLPAAQEPRALPQKTASALPALPVSVARAALPKAA